MAEKSGLGNISAAIKRTLNDIEEIKHALIKAYRTDSFIVFDQFTTRFLRPEETVDEFLTDLQWLAWLVGVMPPEMLDEECFL